MKRLHLEDWPDKRLVTNLGYKGKEITRHGDKGRVCNYLEKQTGLLGMIDEDPDSAQPGYLKTLKAMPDKHQVKLLQDVKTGNKVIILCPRLEEWLIEVCKQNEVDITAFGLSNTGNALHREINNRLNNFDRLLTHLIDKKAPQLKYLKELLKGK